MSLALKNANVTFVDISEQLPYANSNIKQIVTASLQLCAVTQKLIIYLII